MNRSGDKVVSPTGMTLCPGIVVKSRIVRTRDITGASEESRLVGEWRQNLESKGLAVAKEKCGVEYEV